MFNVAQKYMNHADSILLDLLTNAHKKSLSRRLLFMITMDQLVLVLIPEVIIISRIIWPDFLD